MLHDNVALVGIRIDYFYQYALQLWFEGHTIIENKGKSLAI